MSSKEKTIGTKQWMRSAGLAIALAGTLFLVGCQSELYSNLNERETNEMITVLAANGISASRTTDGKGTYGISVSRSDFSLAIAKLSEKGLPRKNFGSLGKVFNSEKLVSTPFEERARFMHALNEELSNSISRINGVVSARVHIMVPETSPFEKNKTPPRASVFVYQEHGVDLTAQIPTVKNLIVNSVDNLEYAFVEVALFEDNTATTSSSRSVASVGSNSLANLVLLGLLGVLAWFGFRMSSGRGSAEQSAPVVRNTRSRDQ